MLKQSLVTLASIGILMACAPEKHQSRSKKIKRSEVIVTSLTADQKALASNLGIEISGDVVMTLRGSEQDIARLHLNSFLDTDDVIIEGPEDGEVAPELFYLAREDFDIPALLADHPTYDGRGVIVGGIDDGVAPTLPGMKLTSEGKRKFLNRTSSSSLYKKEVTLVGEQGTLNNDVQAYTKSYEGEFSKAYEISLDIEKTQDLNGRTLDYNGDSKKEEMSVAVFETAQGIKACFDINNDKKLKTDECLRPFSTSGDYIFWNEENLRELTFEFDKTTSILSFSEGEVAGDSHGEGVASVMTGHKIGGRFDGVAPGAQYLDYDLSQREDKFAANSFYSAGTFLRALEWMGKNNAEVVNISYSLFFVNAKAQEFMRSALTTLVNKYNMVISFSAGNNGPGLGSHNRGGIYPTDSLVAGAFLNRELDEVVHGVTGLPEQGRVVYYSSIGPGVHDGAGPTVISPLSSLTHSSGTDGFRAFNGTSSAAPALAGAAAVLISAVKQEGMEVDAGTIVHAIRQSAKPLEGVSFVEQGRGLPKLTRAIEIYRKMITGKSFKNIEVEVTNTNEDQVKRRGLFYNLSSKVGSTEEIISLKGIKSKLAPTSTAQDLLETVDIEYSHDFISGPQSLWVASSSSRLFITLDFDQAKASGEAELFGEITIKSKASGEILQVVPVTLINDHIFNQSITVNTKLESQAGHRQHLNLPIGTQGVALRFHEGSEFTPYVRAIFYDKSRVKAQTLRNLKPGVTYFIKATDPGLAQFTLARFGGSNKVLDMTYDLTPVSMSLPIKSINSTQDLRVINHNAPMSVTYGIQKISAPIAQNESKVSTSKPYEITAEITSAGIYSFDYELFFEGATTYPRISCVSFKENKNGTITKSFSSSSSFNMTELPGKITFKCYPFSMTDNNAYRGFTIFGSIRTKTRPSKMVNKYIEAGMNTLDMGGFGSYRIEEGARYKLIMKPLVDSLSGGVSEAITISDDLIGF